MTCESCDVVQAHSGHKIPRPFHANTSKVLDARPELADMAQVGVVLALGAVMCA